MKISDWPDGYGRRMLEEVDSTNSEASRIVNEVSGPEWILGRRQTDGRGRRGRIWCDPVGNFAATLILHPRESANQVALRSFVMSLALREALAKTSDLSRNFRLKWPNDVLLNNGKVAGILLESVSAPNGGVRHLFLGVGVNLQNAPSSEYLEPGSTRPVSLLAETGCCILPDEFLNVLAVEYARYEAQFQVFGFEPIREEWLSNAARVGKTITARTQRAKTVGTFETVDLQGNLVLNTADGMVSIPAADIYF